MKDEQNGSEAGDRTIDRWRQRLASRRPRRVATGERGMRPASERPRTVAEAAEELGLSVRAVRAWIASRLLAHQTRPRHSHSGRWTATCGRGRDGAGGAEVRNDDAVSARRELVVQGPVRRTGLSGAGEDDVEETRARRRTEAAAAARRGLPRAQEAAAAADPQGRVGSLARDEAADRRAENPSDREDAPLAHPAGARTEIHLRHRA